MEILERERKRALSVRRFVLAMAVLFLLSVSVEADATEIKEDRVDVFQLKSVTKKRRFELTPLVSFSLNDPFINIIRFGGSGIFHLTEGLGLEVRAWYSLSFPSSLVEELRRPSDLTNENPGVLLPDSGKNTNDIYNPIFGLPQLYIFGSIVWSPLIGKFKLGNSVFDFDLFFSAGAGYIRTSGGGIPPANLFGFSASAGWRVFLSKWISLRIEVQSVFFSQHIRDTNSVLVQHLFFSAGLGFFFPFEPNYSF